MRNYNPIAILLVAIMLQSNTNVLSDGDGFYSWNVTKWNKFATHANLADLTLMFSTIGDIL